MTNLVAEKGRQIEISQRLIRPPQAPHPMLLHKISCPAGVPLLSARRRALLSESEEAIL